MRGGFGGMGRGGQGPGGSGGRDSGSGGESEQGSERSRSVSVDYDSDREGLIDLYWEARCGFIPGNGPHGYNSDSD